MELLWKRLLVGAAPAMLTTKTLNPLFGKEGGGDFIKYIPHNPPFQRWEVNAYVATDRRPAMNINPNIIGMLSLWFSKINSSLSIKLDDSSG